MIFFIAAMVLNDLLIRTANYDYYTCRSWMGSFLLIWGSWQPRCLWFRRWQYPKETGVESGEISATKCKFWTHKPNTWTLPRQSRPGGGPNAGLSPTGVRTGYKVPRFTEKLRKMWADRYNWHLPIYLLTFTEFAIWQFHICIRYILIIVISYPLKSLSSLSTSPPTYNSNIKVLRPTEFSQHHLCNYEFGSSPGGLLSGYTTEDVTVSPPESISRQLVRIGPYGLLLDPWWIVDMDPWRTVDSLVFWRSSAYSHNCWNSSVLY